MSLHWVPTETIPRLENKHKQRKVLDVVLVGASYQRGRRVPGCVRVMLEGGGFCWHKENTPVADALREAEECGFNTEEIRKKFATLWTGNPEGVVL